MTISIDQAYWVHCHIVRNVYEGSVDQTFCPSQAFCYFQGLEPAGTVRYATTSNAGWRQ